ncbi:MAG: PorV/PorQ family protein [bacterium]
MSSRAATVVRADLGLCRALVALAVSLVVSPALAANPGETGLAFLKIGVGAPAAAMGEAYVAVAQDPTALYWNPAGIANALGDEVHATHDEWISDIRYEYVAAVHGMKGQAIGVHAALLHMGELEGRDATGNFTQTFHAYDFSTGLTYAYRFSRSIEIGATGKFLYSKIEDQTAMGFAGDAGIRYRTPIRGLTAAGTVTNLGPAMKFVDDSFTLPAQGRLGVAYRTRALLDGLVVAADLRMPNDSSAKGQIGAELWPHRMFALRGGVMLGYDEQAGTVGFGIEYQSWTIDYAYMPFSSTSDLGDTHRFSLNWRSMPHRES